MCDTLGPYIFVINNFVDLIISYWSTLLIIFITIGTDESMIDLTQLIGRVYSLLGAMLYHMFLETWSI